MSESARDRVEALPGDVCRAVLARIIESIEAGAGLSSVIGTLNGWSLIDRKTAMEVAAGHLAKPSPEPTP